MEESIVVINSPKYGPIYFIIDKEFLTLFNSMKWGVSKGRAGFYLRCYSIRDWYHRIILNVNDSNIQIDHINGNTLDNRKCNLRICPRGMHNAINRSKQENNTSGYKGVFLRKDKSIPTYRAQIRYKQKLIAFGQFDDPKYAASVYDYACSLLFGEFAYLNNTGVQISLEDKLKVDNIVKNQTHEYTYIPKKRHKQCKF